MPDECGVGMNRRKRKAPEGAMIVKHEHAGRIAGAEDRGRHFLVCQNAP